MSVVFFSDICSPSSGYLTLVWRNPCWELRHPAFTVVFKVVWCSRKRFGPLKNLNLAKDDSGAITSAKYVNPDSFFDYWHFGILTAQLGKKSLLFIGKSKTDTHFNRRAQIHMHTQQDGPLSISLPPPPPLCVRGSSRSGEQMSSLLPSPLLPTQQCAAPRKHLSKHWPSPKGPHELAHLHFETRKTVPL